MPNPQERTTVHKNRRLPGTKLEVRYFITAEGIEKLLDAVLEPKTAKEKK